ncbi:hypothetical protein ACQP1K_27265 [Sphaerimonospora sp. CA-214678]|uniref:helix-turn-helix domain-containing protein n=1 Tax=Sphaerimonospora sp. CA-214678 TaxID=3240029 RepID=UPI003D8CE8EC
MVAERLPTWAERLRAERRKRMWSQPDLARHLVEAAEDHIRAHLPRRDSILRRIRSYEAGEHEPRDPYRTLLCRVFGISEVVLFSPSSTLTDMSHQSTGGGHHELGSRALTGEVVASAEAGTHQEGSSGRLEDILASLDMLMRRRDLFPLTGGLAAAAFIHNLSPASPPPYSSALYETCSQMTTSYRRLDNLLGPHAVFTQVVDHHNQLITWVRHARNPMERERMAALAIDSGGLASWLNLDLEQYDQAFALARQASQIALENDDLSRQAYLAGRMSRILCEGHQYQHALQLSDEALRLAMTRADHTLCSWLTVTRAQVHAFLGNDRACRADLEAAADLLDRATDKPEDYIAFHDRGHLYKMAGHALLTLGVRIPTAAVDGKRVIDRALDMWSQNLVRASAEVLAACAAAHLELREIPEAARLTGEAYVIAARTRSPRNLRYISNLRAQLRPYRNTAAVRALDEQLGL